MALEQWIKLAKERAASDLHLEAGTPIVFRIRGELVPGGEIVPGEMLFGLARQLLTPEEWSVFVERRSYDLSKTIQGVRCRINVFQTIRGVSFAIRLLSSFQNNLRDCNLHPDIRRFIEARSGLLIISGPTGSGKSTTLAALVEEINLSQRRQVIILESPIEYFFSNRQSFIRQREIPTHSPSFEQAIVDSMRENPDILIIGEMRTAEVMRLTLNAAETGHLVIATMHSATCAEALSRICMSFAAEMQGSIRTQLADALVGVICQRLNYLPQHQLIVPVCEIATASTAIKSTVRSGSFSQFASLIQTGAEDGMWSFDRYQRWIDQKRDWVRPQQAKPLDADTLNRAMLAPSVSRPKSTFVSSSATRSTAVIQRAVPSDRIEIDVAEDDLEGLVQKIVEDD